MLRPSLHLTLVASVSVAGLTLPAPAYALTSGFVPTTARSLAPNAEADALYEEGRKDFSQGLYKSAIEKFEVAYKRSKDPLILYNIGQSYKKLYEDDAQLEYLKKARTALKDYVAAVEKDPGLGADPEEIKPVLAEIEAEIGRREPAPKPEGPTEPEPAPNKPGGEDPGKKLRLAGVGISIDQIVLGQFRQIRIQPHAKQGIGLLPAIAQFVDEGHGELRCKTLPGAGRDVSRVVLI